MSVKLTCICGKDVVQEKIKHVFFKRQHQAFAEGKTKGVEDFYFENFSLIPLTVRDFAGDCWLDGWNGGFKKGRELKRIVNKGSSSEDKRVAESFKTACEVAKKLSEKRGDLNADSGRETNE